MVDDQELYQALTVWVEQQREPEADGQDSHLDEAALYRLAGAGGLDGAAERELEHLSWCPVCQAALQEWRDSRRIAESEADADDQLVCTVGFLKAAASSLFSEPLDLVSSCGRFELSVYPEVGDPQRGIVALEVLSSAAELESRDCIVRDGSGAIILQGTIEDGRLAGRFDELGRLDLKTWTVLLGSR